MKRVLSRSKAAFTLVEIALAFGVFAFCILVIFGLISVLTNSSRESWMESRSVQIARQIQEDLTPDPMGTADSTTHATASSGMLMTLPQSSQVSLLSTGTTTISAYYAADGSPVKADDSTALFRADVVISPCTVESATGTLPERKVGLLCVSVQPVWKTTAPLRFFSRITPLTSSTSAPSAQ